MVAELDRHYSIIAPGDRRQLTEVEEQLKMLRDKVFAFDLSRSASRGTEVVDKVGQLSSQNRERDRLLVCADDIHQLVMARLEDELVHVLINHRLPVEIECVSFRSAESDSTKDFSSSSFGDEASQVQTGNPSAHSDEPVFRLIHPNAICTLRSIVELMFLSNYEEECCQAYMSVRKAAMDDYLSVLRYERFSIEELLNMDWKTLSSLMKRWNRAMKTFVGVYLAGERHLSDLIFGDLSKSVADTCFVEISKSSIIHLLSFSEAIAIGPPKPEKLFQMLDMYEVLNDQLTDIESLYSDECGSDILAEYREVILQLGESVKRTFEGFKYVIQSYTSNTAFARGGVHPITKYVMNYVTVLVDYSKTLDLLLDDTSRRDQYLSSGAADAECSKVASHLHSVTETLESKLEELSKQYKDDALQNVSMMNNIFYMAQKVKDSDLRKFLGDKWIRTHISLYQQHATSYERASWSSVLSSLTEESAPILGFLVPCKSALKEKFKKFNLAFEELYRVQTSWSVPDVQLRDDLRISISLKVLQAYRSFVGRYSWYLDGIRNRGRYVKYCPDDLARLLLDLFEGSPKLLQ